MDEQEKTYTPQEVFGEQQKATENRKKKLIAKGFIVASCVLVIIMGIVFLISLLYSIEGSFTIRIGDLARDSGGISLSETEGFSNPTVRLNGTPMDGMDNITYEWLPLDELDTKSGSHNGENYIAYTFYVRNSSENPIDYEVTFDILEATRNVDAAVRMMIYRDGVPTIYGKATDGGGNEKYPENVVSFESDKLVCKDTYTNVPSGDTKRYTIVVWLEGEDPECVDSVLKGVMKFEINLEQIKEVN